MNNLLILAAVVVVVVLVIIAGVLHWRLYQQRRAAAEAERRAELKRIEQRERINNSIQVIARAAQARQVGTTEASIRISVLMDALDVDQAVKREFAAFYKLAEEASHIPILEAWKALPKKQRRLHEAELARLEEKYQDFVLDAAIRIQDRHW